MSLSLGAHGPAVGALQQALVEVGEAIDQAELATVAFGHSTDLAVRHYQRAHRLVPDGIVGPHTAAALGGADERFTASGWRCIPTEARPGLVEVLRWAVGRIGTVEQPRGSNRGPEIDAWNERCDIPAGSPWCAAFASAAYQFADGVSVPGIGSAWKWHAWGQRMGLLVEGDLLPGDVGVILRAGGHGHVVLVGAVLEQGRLATVEGNAGNAVRGLVRDRGVFACFVRPLSA